MPNNLKLVVNNPHKQLEEKQLFNWAHPSVEGNLVFYEHVKYKMEKFVNANKK